MPEIDVERELRRLEAELRKLEGEYNMYFGGALPRPPWETRSRVDGLVKQFDRAYIQNYAHRFRFNTLRSRYATLTDLWDRGLRAREEGRAGPFASRRPAAAPAAPVAPPADRVVYVTTVSNPRKDIDKLHELYGRLMDARRESGEQVVPFHKFVGVIKQQVESLQKSGGAEVAFRVAVKNGKASLTVRAMNEGEKAGGS